MSPVAVKPVRCGACRTPLPWSACNQHQGQPCGECGHQVIAAVFPALRRPVERGVIAPPVLTAGDACCFYHDQKQAQVVCNGCGRFLCSLCEIVSASRSLCPGCFQKGPDGNVSQEENKRMLHDNIALMLTLPPLILSWLGLFMAPASIVYSLCTWRKQNTLVPRSRVRFVVAIMIGFLELAGATAMIFMFIAA